MRSRMLGVLFLIVTICLGALLKLNPNHELSIVIFGLLILGSYLGIMLLLNVFNSKNLKRVE